MLGKKSPHEKMQSEPWSVYGPVTEPDKAAGRGETSSYSSGGSAQSCQVCKYTILLKLDPLIRSLISLLKMAKGVDGYNFN